MRLALEEEMDDDSSPVLGSESPDQISLGGDSVDVLPNTHDDKKDIQGRGFGGEDVGEYSSLCGGILSQLLGEAVASACIDTHQTAKLGLMFLYTDALVEEVDSDKRGSPRKMRRDSDGHNEFLLHDSKYTDLFGLPLASAAKIPRAHECQCPECGRTLAAVRFAPHLEKCMGMGRNSSRVASRRMLMATGAGGQSDTRGQRASSVQSSNSRNQAQSDDNNSTDEDYSEAAEEDDDWTGGRRKQVTATRRKPVRRAVVAGEKRRTSRTPAGRTKDAFLTRAKDHPFKLDDDPLLSNYIDAAASAELNTFDMLESPAGCASPGLESLQLRSRKVKKPGLEAVVSLARIQTQPMLTNMGTRAHVHPFTDNYIHFDDEQQDDDDVLQLMESVDTSAFEKLSRDMGSFDPGN